MFSKIILPIILLSVVFTKHSVFGDHGCGLFGNTCGYECFRYCIVAGYGSGGCRRNKCICDWNVINETANAIQQNPNFQQNIPRNTNTNPNQNPNIGQHMSPNQPSLQPNNNPNQFNNNPILNQNQNPNPNYNNFNPANNYPANQPYNNPQYGQPYNQQGYSSGDNRTQFVGIEQH